MEQEDEMPKRWNSDEDRTNQNLTHKNTTPENKVKMNCDTMLHSAQIQVKGDDVEDGDNVIQSDMESFEEGVTDAADETISGGEASPDSADEDVNDIQTAEDPTGFKNRSKRKPSKTQIKHIAPSGRDDCVNSKYGTHNMEDLFKDVTQVIYQGPSSHSLAMTDRQSNILNATPRKRSRRLSQASSASGSVSSGGKPGTPGKSPPSYPCGICGKVFRVPSRYDSHMLGHSKGKPFCCNVCGKMFASQEKLDHHIPVHGTDRKASFTCEMCGKICVNWRAYLYHLKAKHTASGGKRFGCTLCGRQFHTGQRLRNHMASHEIGKNHCCHVCGKLFESVKKLEMHQLVHNLKSKHNQNLQCPDCGKQYTEWIAFKQHMKTHGADGVHYPCGICDEVFPTQYEKEKHKRVHKQVQCEFCERYFRSASVLSVHLRIHTGERPYKCGLCERDFSQASVLKVHMRTHRRENAFECKMCGKSYDDVMEYFKHHMGHLEEGNLQCEECGKVFETVANKNRHMAAHRDRVGRACHVCGKEFGRLSHLEAHMLCHNEQFPLVCKICGQKFQSEEALNTHYAGHVPGELSGESFPTSKGPLFCGLCGKMFKGQIFLKKHMKKHEREGLDSRGGDNTHDEEVVEVENGEFACTECGKRFGEKHHLNVHSRDHTGELPHTCILCGQSFKLRNLLINHIAEHRRNGLMMYTGDPSTPIKKRKKHMKSNAKKLKGGGGSRGSDTDTDVDDILYNNKLIQDPEDQSEVGVRGSMSGITDVTHALPADTYRELAYGKLPEVSFSDNTRLKANDRTPDRQCEDVDSSSYAENQFTRPAVGYIQGDREFVASSVSTYQDRNYSQHKNCKVNSDGTGYIPSRNSSVQERRFSDSPVQSYAEETYETSRKAYMDHQKMSVMKKTEPSLSAISNGTLHPYGVTRNPYGTALPPSNDFSPSNTINMQSLPQHSNIRNEGYSQQDHYIRENLTPAPHMSLKEPGLISSGPMQRSESQLSGAHMQYMQDYKQDVGNYPFSYKSYLSSGTNSFHHRSSFHPGFQGSTARLQTESQLAVSNYQLLPQTAFPDNSHMS